MVSLHRAAEPGQSRRLSMQFPDDTPFPDTVRCLIIRAMNRGTEAGVALPAFGNRGTRNAGFPYGKGFRMSGLFSSLLMSLLPSLISLLLSLFTGGLTSTL